MKKSQSRKKPWPRVTVSLRSDGETEETRAHFARVASDCLDRRLSMRRSVSARTITSGHIELTSRKLKFSAVREAGGVVKAIIDGQPNPGYGNTVDKAVKDAFIANNENLKVVAKKTGRHQ